MLVCKSYLEIGVDDPARNFNKIKCFRKFGVDPNPVSKATFKMDSDTFFRKNTKLFDIIFIDGLHEKDQVLKDVHNSLNCLNENGVIVVHDCNPTTESMQRVPRIQGEWTGDVWRAWLKLRNNEDLSMCVIDCDYGVGIIRKGRQKPINVSDDVTFEQFELNRKEWLNLIPYDDEKVSICIPAFEQYGLGAQTIASLLDSIVVQDGKFEVIVSDNSNDDCVKNVCRSFDSRMDIKYFYNKNRGISINTNNAINKANNDLIKIMYQDDALFGTSVITDTAFALKISNWALFNGFSMSADGIVKKRSLPKFHKYIIFGENYIGMPSVLAFRKNEIRFDESLVVLLDCEFYYLLNEKYGNHILIKRHSICSRYWDYSTSKKQGNYNFIDEEIKYLKEKHSLCQQ